MSLQDMLNNAPAQESFKYTTIGLMTFELERYTWNGKGVPPTKEPLADGMKVEQGQDMFITFTIDSTDVRTSNYPESRRNLKVVSGPTSWSETVLPSLIAVFGKDWLKTASGSYVAFQDVDNSEGRTKDDGSLWGVPQFTAKYANLAEATQADADLRNGGNASTAADLSEIVEEMRQVFKMVKATDRGDINTEGSPYQILADMGKLGAFTAQQVEDAFGQVEMELSI